MTKTILALPLLAFLASHGHCQPIEKAPAFEVASITPCQPGTPAPPGEHNGMVQFTAPGGRFTARATTIKFLMEWAFGILPAQHSGGPSWMEEDRYDILATAGRNATDQEMKLMTQNLLADRFKLKFHRETKEAPVLILLPGKGPSKLYPPKDDEKYAFKMFPQTGEDKKIVSYHIVFTRFSFAQLNLTFARLLGRVIVNRTGLDGDFNFTLDLTPDENRPSPLDPSLLISALRDQLGLTVKAEKAPVDFMMVDSIEKVAAGN
jgi:uncharacterized protein (TIGR03435 family)